MTDTRLLVGLAARTAYTAWHQHRRPATARTGDGLATPARAYAGLLGLTLLNPATIVYFGALVLGRQASDSLSAAARSCSWSACVASASWQLLTAGSGSLVGRILTGPRGRLATALTSSAVITALAFTLVLYGRRCRQPGGPRA